ncbi:MAG: hypothetical protein RIB58_04165 [Phycisphaerales bacterium]
MADESLRILELRDAERFAGRRGGTGFGVASGGATFNWLVQRLPPAPIRWSSELDGLHFKDPCEVSGGTARGCLISVFLGWGVVLAFVLYANSLIYPSPVGPIIGWFMIILAGIVLASYVVRQFRWLAPCNLLLLDQRSGTATITWKRFPGKKHVATTDLMDLAIGVYRLELFEHEARSSAVLRKVIKARKGPRGGQPPEATEAFGFALEAKDHPLVFEGFVAICFAEDLWFALGADGAPDQLLADAHEVARQVPGVRVDHDDRTLIRGIGVRVLRRPKR